MNCKKLIALLCLFLFSSIVVNNDLAHASNKPISTVVAKNVNSEKYVSNDGDLILRDAAHSKGKKVTMLKKGSKVFVYSTDENGWSYVKQGKLKGYVKDSYLLTKKTPKKPSKETTIKPKGYGTLKGNITWQYNQYIGTKPDVGANVIVFPKNFKPLPSKKIINVQDGKVDASSIGIYYGEVDGYGSYEINRIPAGEYLVLIVSLKTFTNYMEPMNRDDEKLLKRYVSDFEQGALGVGVFNYLIKNINLEVDEEELISKDWGYSY